MLTYLLGFLLCCAVAETLVEESTTGTLRFVAIVSRHGSRSPLWTYKLDPYPYNKTEYWPDGPGQLTNYGKFQMYQLGNVLRERYDKFLDRNYYPEDVVVEYNPYDRDFTSAATILAGLYPPVGQQVWNPTLNWQPIPISVRSFDICDLVIPKTGCPLFVEESNRMLKKLDSISDQYKILLKTLSEGMGENTTKLSDLGDLYDTLLMQLENGYELPDWTKEFFPAQLYPWNAIHIILQYAGSETLLSLGAGPELKHLSEMFNCKANGTSKENKKMYIETAHDCTLVSLLYALGFKKPDLLIETGAYLVFELREISSSLFIEIYYYKNPFDKAPYKLNMKECPNPCPLKDFNSFVDSLNPKDWSQLCHKTKT